MKCPYYAQQCPINSLSKPQVLGSASLSVAGSDFEERREITTSLYWKVMKMKKPRVIYRDSEESTPRGVI
jgi:hypothetical protein